MDFYEVLDQVVALLRTRGRVTYRALKLQFQLDDEHLETLKEELIQAQRVAADEDGKVLLWVGASLVPGSTFQVPNPQPPDSGLSSGERRHLTVQFIDLVGSTTLSEQLDPEELREVIQAYRETCATVIRRFEGYLAKYIGDGLLVYFGYPRAHEDDAQRAVRAGLGIIEAIHALPLQNIRLQQPLRVRIGIHTGLVVAGEMGVSDQPEPLAIVGETPNIAARLQGLAEPDTVVLSAATQRLVAGLFECQDLGPQFLKGLSTSLSVYRVVRESEAQSRFEVVVRTGLTPLIGRTHEMGLLQERWARASLGEGQVVLLNGEAGIGKSRLVQELKEQVSGEGATCLAFRCSPYHQHSAYYPIIDHLQRLLQFEREDTPQTRLSKLRQVLADYRFPQADTVALLAALLSLPHPEGIPPLTLSPQKQKQKIEEALVAWIVEEAEKAPVYCAWEDLHWADPSTLEVLTLYLEQILTVRMFTVLTFRPDFTPPWGPHSYFTQLTLNRLGRQQVEAMVEQVTGGKVLPSEVLRQIVAKTDGVPLFVEELTKMVIESVVYVGARRAVPLPLAIPATLQDALMARLDRLGSVKEIAQMGATLGREFSYELFHAVSPLDEATLQQGLRQLVDAELLYQRGLSPRTTYFFKHALIQDTAYQSLLKSRRQQLHQQIAQVLAEQFPETVETQPELLAHHYTEAGLLEHAIPYWQKAGEHATQRSANVEAIAHFSKGLELLKTLPETPERSRYELTLQIALGPVVIAAKGYAAPEVERIYTRARELCQQMGKTPQLFPVLIGLWVFYDVRAEHQTAHQLAGQGLSLAQHVKDPSLLTSAHISLGETLFWLGELPSARAHFERGATLCDSYQARPTWVWVDYRVSCLSAPSVVLWYLGYPDQALRKSQEALTRARELAHPFTLAFALNWAVPVRQARREGQAVQERAEAQIALAREQGFPDWLAWGTIWRGWALAEQGQEEEGIAQMRQGLTALRPTGAEISRPYCLGLLAEVYGKAGRAEEGLATLAEALALVDKTGERMYEAELYRLKGTFTLKQFGVRSSEFGVTNLQPLTPDLQAEAEAESCFLKAVEIARHQQTKSLELRAVMSLARLWQQQGKKEEAHRMLVEIYGWFTEGFDTADLQEAKTLLEELGG
jgi:class 3 adenylate cyclase/predicted ATPase